jgi:zinc protease
MMLSLMLSQDLYAGRTMQFQADLEQKIAALRPDAVNAALRKYIDPKRISVVKAGDFKEK